MNDQHVDDLEQTADLQNNVRLRPCEWAGHAPELADRPRAETMVVLQRPCRHGRKAVFTCPDHMRSLIEKEGRAQRATRCSECGLDNRLTVVHVYD